MPKTLYRTKSRPEYDSALRELRSHGLSPIPVGNPDRYRGAGLKVYFLGEIAVPDEEVDRAREVLTAWERARRRDVRHLTGPLNRAFALIIAGFLLLLAVIAWRFPAYLDSACLGIPVAGLGVVFALNHLKALRRK